jgi:hypothetical protein
MFTIQQYTISVGAQHSRISFLAGENCLAPTDHNVFCRGGIHSARAPKHVNAMYCKWINPDVLDGNQMWCEFQAKD